MPSRRSPRFYFDDILTAIADIRQFTNGINSSEDLARDRKTLHAVFRNLEVIGEACRQMPRKIKTDKNVHNFWYTLIKNYTAAQNN